MALTPPPSTPVPAAPSAPGDAPSRANPTTFRALADAFIVWLVGFRNSVADLRSWLAAYMSWAGTHVSEIGALQLDVDTKAEQVATNASTVQTIAATFGNVDAAVSAAAGSASAAATQAGIATDKAGEASTYAIQAAAAKTSSEAARDAALIQAGIYVDEPTGRAAVADGAYFKVVGSGEVAAYEYRRISSSASALIGLYPNADALGRRVTGFRGKNIHNPATAALGKFPDNTNGNLGTNASYNTTDFIRITAGLDYSVSVKHYWCWYDASRNFISGTSDANTSKTQTAPTSAVYMRASCPVTSWATFQVEQASAPTTYEAYSDTVYLLPGAVREGTLTADMLAAGAVGPTKTTFLPTGKNKFNKATATLGSFMGPDGNPVVNATYGYSDFIAVTPGQAYSSNAQMRFTTYYSASKQWVTGGSSVGVSTFTPPAGVAFVKVTFTATGVDTFQLEEGSVSTGYAAFGYDLRPGAGEFIFLNPAYVSLVSRWDGTTWGSLGDSITAAGTYQAKVALRLGLVHTAYGVGGTLISGAGATAMCNDARINAMPTTLGLVTVMGGTNDWVQNVALGTETSSDVTTFYGALNTMISKLMVRFPAKRVVMLTTPYGEMLDFASRGWANGYTNTLGLTTRDYAEAVRVACRRWGIPFFDVAMKAGWNNSNLTTYLTNDGNYIHPNSSGAERIAQVVLGGLRDIEATA